VPEATIDEDSHSLATEYNVRAAADAGYNRPMKPEAKTGAM